MRVAVLAVACAFGLVGHAAAQEPREVFKKGDAGVVMPTVIKETKPRYNRDAMRARVQGNIVMDVVVEPTGNVGEVKVTKSLDEKFGLDEEAVRTVKEWKFKPGTRNGKPVPVRVEIEMTFTLR